ncbi:putative RNA methylase [Allocatelliglobosispora scoriae]|uniref:Putative RNA methylase n=1 Tax=Allocatelliglobosispora scoriae TaxID=643052 RepID=A0A841BR46_9ACTN|nr:methyltransferase domain-containing protein [Allocatelliglobosispora scoriae]MBB5869383.1 putative RNA methylase [Allocatelliglobosispora scoriae]
MSLDIDALLAERKADKRLRELGEHLRDLAYSGPGLATAIGAANVDEVLSESAMYAYAADVPDFARADAATVLGHLFVLNRPVPTKVIRGALGKGLTKSLDGLGLLAEADGVTTGRASLTPFRSQYFLSDRLFRSAGTSDVTVERPPQVVMPPHASTFALNAYLGDQPPGAFLDLGCGCGFAAITRRRSHTRVLGIDINPRAVAFSTANAFLNDVDATFAVGDASTVGPAETGGAVAGLAFNTPTGFSLGNAELEADRAMAMVAGAAQRLSATVAQAFVIVEVPQDFESAAEVLEEWFSGYGFRSVRTAEVESPYFRISAADVGRRRVPGRCLLLSDRTEADALLDALAARKTREVVGAVVTVKA